MIIETSAKIREKLYRNMRRLVNIPKYAWLKVFSFNAISAKGLQRWEYGFKIHFSVLWARIAASAMVFASACALEGCFAWATTRS